MDRPLAIGDPITVLDERDLPVQTRVEQLGEAALLVEVRYPERRFSAQARWEGIYWARGHDDDGTIGTALLASRALICSR